VRACYEGDWAAQEDHANQQAELEAERRNERWFEERGGSQPEDPREVEAQMMDDLRRETAAIQAKERDEDELVYRQKMERDEALAAGAILDSMTGSHGRDMASEKQVKYAMDLLAEREWPDTLNETDIRNMERRQVTKLITNLKDAPRRPVSSDEPAVGMYKDQAGRILRVYLGQQSGRNLVKEVVEDGQYEDGITKYSYEYVGSARSLVAGLTPLGKVTLERMPLEEAKKWGKMTRSCVVCARRLDVPESVERGIGPVCASKEW
jgi:hypothetical protein